MSEHRKLEPEELERRVRLLQEAVSRMTMDELSNLIRDIQLKMRDSEPRKANQMVKKVRPQRPPQLAACQCGQCPDHDG